MRATPVLFTKVMAGETLTAIANRTRVAPMEILHANPQKRSRFLEGHRVFADLTEGETILLPRANVDERLVRQVGLGRAMMSVGLGAAVYRPDQWDFSACTYTVPTGPNGDSPDVEYQIAQLYGVTVHDINQLNPPGDPAVYWKIDAVIKMPKKACDLAKALQGNGVTGGSCPEGQLLDASGNCVPDTTECADPTLVRDATGACVPVGHCTPKSLYRSRITGQLRSATVCTPPPATPEGSSGGLIAVVAIAAVAAIAVAVASSSKKSSSSA